MRIATIALTLAAAAAMLGCTAQARSPEPVPVDRVSCAHCGMLVSTESGAGEIVSDREDTRFYDDLACLAADWRSRHDDTARAFVQVTGGGWSEVSQAFFARPAGAHTAMGSGVVAFASRADALRADRDARVLSWADVVQGSGGGQ
jgi:nitrous oxide reductase accessory protein NosL